MRGLCSTYQNNEINWDEKKLRLGESLVFFDLPTRTNTQVSLGNKRDTNPSLQNHEENDELTSHESSVSPWVGGGRLWGGDLDTFEALKWTGSEVTGWKCALWCARSSFIWGSFLTVVDVGFERLSYSEFSPDVVQFISLTYFSYQHFIAWFSQHLLKLHQIKYKVLLCNINVQIQYF